MDKAIKELIDWMASTETFKANGEFEFKVRYNVARIKRAMADAAEGVRGWTYIKTDGYEFMFNVYTERAALYLRD